MKKVLSVILSLAMMCSISTTATLAAPVPKEVPMPTVEVDASIPDMQPVNLCSVESTPRNDGTGIDVYIGNLGVDGLDSVTVSVTATDHPTAITQTAYVIPLVGKNFKFNIPMTKCDMTYNIVATVIDGGQKQTFNRTTHLVYSEKALAATGWGAGTYGSRKESVNQHFQKHHNDSGVNASNIVQYLAKAVNTYNDTLKNPGNYRIVAQAQKPGFVASHKYTHKTTGLFIIYGDSNDTIYTFGGR